MKEMNDIVTALKRCSYMTAADGLNESYCTPCAYCEDKSNARCIDRMMIDAADALEAADKRIAELEAQLPKEGEWIDEQRGRWIYAKCNLCGKVQDVRSNYCPNCGARMQTVTDCHTLEEGER